MGNEQEAGDRLPPQMERELLRIMPTATTAFRHRAWLDFQRTLDPLAPPRPFRNARR